MATYPHLEVFPGDEVFPGGNLFVLNKEELPTLSHLTCCLSNGRILDTDNEATLEDAVDVRLVEQWLLSSTKVMIEG